MRTFCSFRVQVGLGPRPLIVQQEVTVSILGPSYIPSIPLFVGGGPSQGIRLVEVSGLEVRVSDGSGSLGWRH